MTPGKLPLMMELKEYLYGNKERLSKDTRTLAEEIGFKTYLKGDEGFEPQVLKIDEEAIAREKRTVYHTDIDYKLKEHRWMDDETAKRAALIDKRISYNEDRILDSDKLYETLIEANEEGIERMNLKDHQSGNRPMVFICDI